MTKKLLTTTALLVMFSGAAMAQTATPAPAASEAGATSAAPMKLFEGGQPTPMESANGYFTAAEGQVLASQLMDEDVYTAAGEEGEDIGEVEDLLFDGAGQLKGIVVSVGGFLGMGQKEVAIDVSSVSVMPDPDDADEWRVVVEQTREQLEAAPEFERDVAETVPGSGAATGTEPAPAGTMGTAPETTTTPPATQGTETSPSTGTAPSPTTGGSTSQ